MGAKTRKLRKKFLVTFMALLLCVMSVTEWPGFQATALAAMSERLLIRCGITGGTGAFAEDLTTSVDARLFDEEISTGITARAWMQGIYVLLRMTPESIPEFQTFDHWAMTVTYQCKDKSLGEMLRVSYEKDLTDPYALISYQELADSGQVEEKPLTKLVSAISNGLPVTCSVRIEAQYRDNYTVTYDANGGEGTVTDPASPYVRGAQVTVLENGFAAPAHAVFKGWNTEADGSGASYGAGDVFEIERPLTLYAQWKHLYVGIEEGFDEEAIPEGWTVTVTPAKEDYSWWVGVGDFQETPGTHAGERNAIGSRLPGHTPYSSWGTSWLISPVLDMSGVEGILSLSFWYVNRAYSKYVDEFSVNYRIDGGEWQELFYTREEHGTWTKKICYLPDEIRTANVEIGFKAHCLDGNGIGLDDVVLEELESVQTMKVCYDANGGSGSVTDQASPYYVGKTVEVLPNGFTAPVKKGFTFWNTKADGSGVKYEPSDQFDVYEDVTLYAQWVDYLTGLNENFEVLSCLGTWRVETNDYPDKWMVNIGTYYNYGPHAGKYCAQVRKASGSETGKWTTLVTPRLDLSGMAGLPKLSFWYQNRSDRNMPDDVSVCYRVNEGEWIELFRPEEAHNEWIRQVVFLPEEAKTENVEIGFRVEALGSGFGLAIDDLLLEDDGPSYALTYDANGGSGEMTDPNAPYHGEMLVTVLPNEFTAAGKKRFVDWNTKADGSGTAYRPGDAFTINGDVTLYAQWRDPIASLDEGFEGDGIPRDWNVEADSEAFQWNVGVGDYNEYMGSHSGNQNARLACLDEDGQSAWLISPVMDLDGATGFPALSFWYVNRSRYYSRISSPKGEEFSVCYRVGDGEWQELFRTEKAREDWTRQVLYLPEEALTDGVEIGFHVINHSSRGFGLDDVTFTMAEEPLYAVSVEDGISGGAVSADCTFAGEGEAVTLTVSPDGNRELVELLVRTGNGSVAFTKVDETTYSFTMPKGDVAIEATFRELEGIVFWEDFEGIVSSKWTLLDADGDGKNWSVRDYVMNAYDSKRNRLVHSIQCALTADVGAGTSDNWAITPAITVSENTTLSFWMRKGSDGDESPNLAVCVGIRPAAESMIKVAELTASPAYDKYEVDLSAFAGQTVYLGFLIHNANKMDNLYLDDVLVVGGVAPLTDGSLKIARRSLTLYDTIAIDFKVSARALEGYHDPYLLLKKDEETFQISEYVIVDNYYVFTYRVAPQMMGDTVMVTPHARNADGEDVTGVATTYSVAQYCQNVLGNASYQIDEYATLRQLLVDILLYGDAAQLYSGYKTDNLVSSFLSDEQRAMGTDVTVAMNYASVRKKNCATVENPLASIETAALFLEAAVDVQFKYEASDLAGLRVVVTEDEAGTNVLGEYPADASQIDGNGRYYVTFDYLNAGQMRKTVYATVMKGSDKVSNTFRYSIESYAYSMTGREGYESLGLLLDAMMRYGDSAAAFVNNN